MDLFCLAMTRASLLAVSIFTATNVVRNLYCEQPRSLPSLLFGVMDANAATSLEGLYNTPPGKYSSQKFSKAVSVRLSRYWSAGIDTFVRFNKFQLIRREMFGAISILATS